MLTLHRIVLFILDKVVELDQIDVGSRLPMCYCRWPGSRDGHSTSGLRTDITLQRRKCSVVAQD